MRTAAEGARKGAPPAELLPRRTSSEAVLKYCEKLGIAFLPWYPLGAGAALRSSTVISMSKKLNATPAQIAIAWLLQKSPAMLPIPGTSSTQHLEENVASAGIRLP